MDHKGWELSMGTCLPVTSQLFFSLFLLSFNSLPHSITPTIPPTHYEGGLPAALRALSIHPWGCIAQLQPLVVLLLLAAHKPCLLLRAMRCLPC